MNPQVANFQRCKHVCHHPYVSCCTVPLYFPRYCTVILAFYFLFVFYVHIICVKSIINLLQYYTIIYIRLCQLDTQANFVGLTNWTYEHSHRIELVLCRGLTVFYLSPHIILYTNSLSPSFTLPGSGRPSQEASLNGVRNHTLELSSVAPKESPTPQENHYLRGMQTSPGDA